MPSENHTSESLISEYAKIRDRYDAATSLRKKSLDRLSSPSRTDGNFQDEIETSSLHSFSRRYKPSAPAVLPEYQRSTKEIENEFIRQIKVSSIRAVHEKKLIQTFSNLISHYKEGISSLSTCIKEWESYSDKLEAALIDDIQDLDLELSREVDEKRTIIQEQSHLKANHSKELDKLQEEKQDLIRQHEEAMLSFLNEMENTVEEYKRETEQRENVLKKENNGLKDDLESAKNKRNQNEDNFESERAHHNNEICKLRSQVEMLLEDKSTSEQQMKKIIDETIQSTEDRHIAELSVAQGALETLRIQHEQELGKVEYNVKQMIEFKDTKLKQANQRAEKADARAKAFEMCIADIENGLEERT